jgi:hypothetical protein
MGKIKFNVVKRDNEECEHDTGIHHDIGMSCREAERLFQVFAMDHNDPDHEAIWHSSRNPDLIQVNLDDIKDLLF